MSKQYAKKIRAILNESTQTVPYIFERFYTIVKQVSLSLRDYDSDPKILEQFSSIYKAVKKYIKDEPYTMVGNTEKIQKELKTLINPLIPFVKQDNVEQKIIQLFLDEEVSQDIEAFISKAEILRKEIAAKNQRVRVFGTNQLANAFWVNMFQSEYAVHFEIFWTKFLDFIKQIPYFAFFICESSKKSIRRKVDPERKFYVTSSNVKTLFQILSEPLFLQRLADETAKGEKIRPFVSKDFLEIEFISQSNSIQTNLSDGECFEISGEDTLVGETRRDCRYAPTVVFGSGMDSDIRIKSKYISRKQFMIIEEDEDEGDALNINLSNMSLSSKNKVLQFSLVCLSSSNFTMVSYSRAEKLKPGMIFKVGDTAVQVLKISNVFKEAAETKGCQQNSDEDEEDNTLDYLPKKAMVEVSDTKQMEYTFLSGPQKGKKAKVTSASLMLEIEQNLKVKLIYQSDCFFVPPETRIYVKTANQVVNGELSHRLPLEENMTIFLQECRFQIK